MLKFLAVVFFYASLYALFMPVDKSVLQVRQNRLVYSQEGYHLRTLLEDEYSAWQTFLPLSDFPPDLVKMVVQEEDEHFFWHSGVDVSAVLRAAYQNITAQKIVSGASTLSMQLARTVFVSTQKSYDKKNIWAEKFLQMYRALRLENNFTKKEILQAYLNFVPLPHNIQGLPFFASQILQKDIQLLSPLEMSIITALIQEHLPSKKTLHRRAWRIFLQNYHASEWDEKEFSALWDTLQAGKEKKKVFKETLSQAWRTPHLLNLLQSQKKTQGTTIKTSVSSQWSERISEIINSELKFLTKYNTSQAAVVVLERGNLNGRQVWFLRAMLGSQDFNSHEGENNGALSMRQAGSTLKPFLYALAFEENFLRPWHWVEDKRKSFYATKFSPFVYHPKNYDLNYWGEIRAREALATSRNIPAVEIITRLGVDNFFNFLKQTQIGNYPPAKNLPDYYGPGMALGNSGIHLLGITRAYGIFSAQGELLPLVYGWEHESKNAPQLYVWEQDEKKSSEQELQPRRFFSRESSLMISDILSDASLRKKSFGKRSFLDFPYKVAVKTGSSKDYKDSWTVGYNDRYVVGVWVGNFSGEKMNSISGAFGAGRIFHQVFRYLQAQNRAALTLPQNLGWATMELCRQKNVLQCESDAGKEFFYLPPSESQRKPRDEEKRDDAKQNNNFLFDENQNSIFYSPLLGEQFLYDPHVPAHVQKIPLYIKLPPLPACKIYLDGAEKFSFSSAAEKDFKNVLPFDFGHHTLELYCDSKSIQKTWYQVSK